MANSGSYERLLGNIPSPNNAGAPASTRHRNNPLYHHHQLLNLPTAAESITYNTSWSSRVSHLWRLAKSSPYRLLIGIAFFVSSAALLVWNEGHAVQTSQSLDEGYDLVVSLPTADLVMPENDGKVVHVSGQLSAFPPLADYRYNVKIDAVRLKRRVQMFQWIEEEEVFESEPSPMNRESSPDVSYSYSTAWKDKLVDSGLFNIPFGHENPTEIPLLSEIQTTEVVKIGSYLLSPEIIETFTSYEPFSGDEEPTGDDVKLHAGMYYETRDIFNPDVGDIRVQFYYAGHSGNTYSMIGEQRGATLYPYTSSSGQSLVLLQQGQRSPEEVFATHHAHTRLRNWGIRILGFFGLCAATTVTHHLVYAVVSWFAVLRDVSVMSGGHFAMTVAMSLSLAIIALSWCVYRPGLAVCLGLLALLPAIKSGYYGESRRRGHDGNAPGGGAR